MSSCSRLHPWLNIESARWLRFASAWTGYSLSLYDSEGHIIGEEFKDAALLVVGGIEKVGSEAVAKVLGAASKVDEALATAGLVSPRVETKDFVTRFGNEPKIAKIDQDIAKLASDMKLDLTSMSPAQATALFQQIDARIPEFQKLYGFKAQDLPIKIFEKYAPKDIGK